MLDIRYVAGLIDADGSFVVSLGSRRITQVTINPAWTVNFRSIHPHIVEEVQEKMGCGKVYHSRRLSENNRMGIWSWQTTKLAESLLVAKWLRPHLHIKQEVCDGFIHILEKWMSYPRKAKPMELKAEILEFWLTANDCTQTRTARKNKEEKIIQFRQIVANG